MSNNIEGKIVVITGASRGWAKRLPAFSPSNAPALCWVRGAWIAFGPWRTS